MSDLFEKIMGDVAAERLRQDALWGAQRYPNGTSLAFKPLADAARNSCNAADANGTKTWMHIMREETWEALAETDRIKLRAELIQLITVGVRWVENLDEDAV